MDKECLKCAYFPCTREECDKCNKDGCKYYKSLHKKITENGKDL